MDFRLIAKASHTQYAPIAIAIGELINRVFAESNPHMFVAGKQPGDSRNKLRKAWPFRRLGGNRGKPDQRQPYPLAKTDAANGTTVPIHRNAGLFKQLNKQGQVAQT